MGNAQGAFFLISEVIGGIGIPPYAIKKVSFDTSCLAMGKRLGSALYIFRGYWRDWNPTLRNKKADFDKLVYL